MKSRYLSSLAAVLFTLLARPVCAAGVAIAWNASDDSDLAGYVVKYGPAPHDYRTTVDVGRATTFSASDMVVGQTYYFTVQAYAADGTLSAPAAELPAVISEARGRATAHLVAPQAGQRDVTSAQVFRWEAVPQAQAYCSRLAPPGAATTSSTAARSTAPGGRRRRCRPTRSFTRGSRP